MYWTLEKRSIHDLVENFRNPRRLTKFQAEHLKKSLGKFGLCEPVVINRDDTIIGGHQRVKTLKSMGVYEIDVYVPERMLTLDEAQELTIRLNKNSGKWDIDMLANHWNPEELIEWGFTMDELQLESIPEQTEDPKKFGINISCTDADQLALMERHIATIVDDFSGSKYKVRVK